MEELTKENVARFFDARAEMDIPILNRALFQEKQGDLAQRRDEIEKEAILSLIDHRLIDHPDILDAGCGTGRLSLWLHFLGASVRAFDVSPGLIELCRQQVVGVTKRLHFSIASIDDFDLGEFDVIIISGVCLFTTDDMWPGIMRCIRYACKKDALIVIREAMGTAGRFELHGIWSQELGSKYSAIYRDPDWFRGLFGQFCDLLHDDVLLPDELEKWTETRQRLMLWKCR